ncbi:MAG: hypothetical protein FWC67_02720 [Defluviitaleaceae bacterium]|nr:hypothetical protein [Defluviitaleaceae bacterium]
MSGILAVITLFFVSLLSGALIYLQWLPGKDGEPPPKPLPAWAAVCAAVVLGGAFIGIVIMAVLNLGE